MALLDLPIELHELVCEHVDDTKDFGNLRLVSRELDQRTARAFARRLCATFNMCTQHRRRHEGMLPCYKELLKLACHPVFSATSQHLRIWPTYFADTFDRADLYRSAIYIDRSKQTAATHEELRAFTEDCRLEHLDAFVEQQNRIDDGRDVILLRDAFSGLSSLKSITIGCLDAGCGDDKHKEIVIPSTAQQLSSNCSMRRKGKGDKARRNALSCTFITVIKAVVWTKKPLEALTVGIGRCHEQLSDYVQLKALHHATGMIDQSYRRR
ncbi:hypothetical protein LTR65_007779 [Meristemomyces frigidus]